MSLDVFSNLGDSVMSDPTSSHHKSPSIFDHAVLHLPLHCLIMAQHPELLGRKGRRKHKARSGEQTGGTWLSARRARFALGLMLEVLEDMHCKTILLQCKTEFWLKSFQQVLLKEEKKKAGMEVGNRTLGRALPFQEK